MSQFIDITQYNVPSGTSKRFRCPNCGGQNTLSVSNAGGTVKYYCFKASCNTKGIKHRGLTLSDLSTSRKEQQKFAIPDTWVMPLDSSPMAYLKRNHCWEAFRNKWIDIRVDNALGRIVFIHQYNGELGAVGRLISKQHTNGVIPAPKWYKYPGSTKWPLICGRGSEQCVIVEDAASACAVSSVSDGLSILGTHITDEGLLAISKYKQAVICLDPDAKLKALRFHKLLSLFLPTRVVFAPDDLKYFSPKEITEILNKSVTPTNVVP